MTKKKKETLIQMVVAPDLARTIKKCAASNEESVSSFVRRVVANALADMQGPKTLRDEFAMAALTGLLASRPMMNRSEEDEFWAMAYVYADRMLVARKAS
jgi:hypothetical protein